MIFRLISFFSSHESYLEHAVDLYNKKINRMETFEYRLLKTKHFPREKSDLKIDFEQGALIKLIKPQDKVILFDENGKNIDSVRFSNQLQNMKESSAGDIVFIIGGAYGVGPEIKSRADLKVCLSPFVLNHHVAQVVALEQIYRAFTIQRNIPYHNE